jgi:RND family efflux transporter MFP subunit
MKPWIWLLPVAALLAGAAVWGLRPLPVATLQATRGEAVEAVFATGAVEPVLQLPVAPRAGSRLAALLVDEGDRVRAGQLLARLETAESDAQLQELAARLQAAELQLARAEALVAQKFIAAGEAERARAERDALLAQTRRLQAQRGYALLVAPAAGTVLRRDGEVGQFVAAGQAVFVLGDPTRLRVSAEVDEEDIPRVRVGMPALLRAPALGSERVFDGEVAAITPRGDPVARSYRVRVALPQVPTGLRVGMTVDLNLVAARRTNALLLPARVLKGGKVWLLVDGRAQERTLKTGAVGNGRVEVLEGLKDGERVIDTDTPLREGQRVKARP